MADAEGSGELGDVDETGEGVAPLDAGQVLLGVRADILTSAQARHIVIATEPSREFLAAGINPRPPGWNIASAERLDRNRQSRQTMETVTRRTTSADATIGWGIVGASD